MSLYSTSSNSLIPHRPQTQIGDFEEKNGLKLSSYGGDNINGEAFDEKSRTPGPIRAYCQAAATLNLLRAISTAMQRVTQCNLDFTEQSEQGDR